MSRFNDGDLVTRIRDGQQMKVLSYDSLYAYVEVEWLDEWHDKHTDKMPASWFATETTQ